MNKLTKQEGITLVEVLATIVILSIVSVLAYSILFQGFSNYQRVKAETELRDEADLIMASFIREMFTLKLSEVSSSTAACETSAVPDSFLRIKKPESPTAADTGFKSVSASSQQAFVKGTPVQFHNENVTLVPNQCSGTIYNSITPLGTAGTEFTIKFRLQTVKGKTVHVLDFENTVQIIDDSEEDAADETASK